MLSNQWSPYVGRFACGWHRLPENVSPGNHRPRHEPDLSYPCSVGARQSSAPSGDRASEGSRRGHELDVRRPVRFEDLSASRGGRARGENVINQQHAVADGSATRPEGPGERGPPILAGAPSLGGRIPRAHEQASYGQVQTRRERPRQQLRLIEAPPRSTTPRERNPGDHVRIPAVCYLRHGPGQMGRHGMRADELHRFDGARDGPLVQEGCARSIDGNRRAVDASVEGLIRRPPAPPAPGWGDHADLLGTGSAERPRPSGVACGAPWRKERVQDLHAATLRRGADTALSRSDEP
jgi:hypothetical protein